MNRTTINASKAILVASLTALASSVFAEDTLDKKPGPLSDKEAASLSLARKWMETPEKPQLSADGKVTFLYGQTLPTLFCSPFYASDVELQPGEKVRDVHLADTIRWVATPAVSGSDDAPTTHVSIKLKNIDLSTTLTIYTDRRVYTILLKSSADNWTPRLAFEYPQEIQRAWANYQTHVEEKKKETQIPETQQDMSQLDFGYEIKGDASWKPVRVYNDGVKTYIQMPKAMAQTEAPALLVENDESKAALVNYRLVGDRYVVDLIFKKAALIAGVGRKQTKVKIIHTSSN